MRWPSPSIHTCLLKHFVPGLNKSFLKASKKSSSKQPVSYKHAENNFTFKTATFLHLALLKMHNSGIGIIKVNTCAKWKLRNFTM